MINKERMLILVKALEEEGLAQCRGKLEKVGAEGNHSYCCLGVATRKAMENGLEVTAQVLPDNVVLFAAEDGEVEENLLLESVKEWYGFDSSNPEVLTISNMGNMVKIPVSFLNDGEVVKRHTFPEIGKIMRENFLTDDTENVNG